MSNDKPLPPMPPARGRYREVWVGLFVVAGIAAVLVTLMTMTNAAVFRGRYYIYTNVPNASGIRKGDPVLMRGVNVGRILRFDIREKGVDMRLEIEGEYKIPRDSRVEIKANGLLGGMVADVIPGTSSETLKWGDRIPGSTGQGLFDKMDALAGQADKIAVRVQGMLDEQTVQNLKGSAANAHESLAQLQSMLKEQRGELRDLTSSLRRSAQSVEKVTSGPELERTVQRIDRLTERLEGTSSTLDRSSNSLDAILARMERGEGTLGKLSKDDQLYKNAVDATDNFNKAAQELQKLLGDLRANPKKYINLKIF
ncbi:MAG TPA: MlaD family protein [Vicinamibacteria bacterium]|nr:MlaD family protein [Vicinamibacteria bacterium]